MPTTTKLRDAAVTVDDPEDGRVVLCFQINRFAHGGAVRIDLLSNEYGPWATLNVNPNGFGLEPGEYLIKTWGGDTWKEVAKSGLFVDTGKRQRCGYAEGHVWRLAEGVEL